MIVDRQKVLLKQAGVVHGSNAVISLLLKLSYS